jgi:uncharacterized membrane protein YgcG
MAGFDYDELARRLLVQVVRRLAAPEAPPSALDRPAADQPADAVLPGAPDPSVLQETVSALEYELATAWTKHGKLAEENARLREQLKAAQRSLAQAATQVRRLPVSTGLNDSEVVLLQRLLSSEPAADGGGADGGGADGRNGADGGGGADGRDGLAVPEPTPDMLARSTGAEAAG